MNATLPNAEHREILERLIVPNALRGTSPVRGRPRAIIIAGAPGSGKGGLTAEARRDLAGDPQGHVEIDVDELRWYHREYRPLMLANDRTAATAVHVDATHWGDTLRRRCIEQRRNLIVDGTLKDTSKALAMCGELRDAGYDVEVRVIGLPREMAVQGVYARYERARAEGRPGRWVPELVVDAAHMGVPDAVAALHERGAVDRIRVYHRDPRSPVDERGRLRVRVASTTSYGPAPHPSEPAPHDVLRHVRTRRLTAAERVAYRVECRRICEAIAQRDSSLIEPENRRAFELARSHGADVRHPALEGTTAPKRPQGSHIVDFTPPPPRERGSATPRRARTGRKEAPSIA